MAVVRKLTPEQEARVSKLENEDTQLERDLGASLRLKYNVDNGPGEIDGMGGEAWNAHLGRYRDMAGREQAPIALDETQANEARGVQMGSLGLLDDAARGGAPSQAAILGRAGIGDAMRSGLSGLAGARGPGAAVAGVNGSMQRTGTASHGVTQGALTQSGREMSLDMGALSSVAGAVRGQDVTAATTNARLEAERRRLDDANRQFYERQAQGVRMTQLGAGAEMDQQHQGRTQAYEDGLSRVHNKQAADKNTAISTGTAVGGAVMTGGTSAAVQGGATVVKKR